MSERTVTAVKWTLLTNVAFVDNETRDRLWCHALLIDREPSAGFGGSKIRQIRGMTWGGLPTFTMWIDPGCEVEVFPHDGGANVLLSYDGTFKNLDGGAVVRAGDRVLRVNVRDFEQPIRIEHIDQPGCPFGDEMDERLVRFEHPTSYRPHVRWVPAAPGVTR